MATRYKVKAGFHCDGEGNTFKKGQEFVSDRPLHKTYANKFDIVAVDVEAPKKKKKDTKSRFRSSKDSKPLEEIGKDVSQRFPEAVNQGLRVWQTEEGDYSVTAEKDLFTPLNKKPLSRIGVRKFLDNYQ